RPSVPEAVRVLLRADDPRPEALARQRRARPRPRGDRRRDRTAAPAAGRRRGGGRAGCDRRGNHARARLCGPRGRDGRRPGARCAQPRLSRPRGGAPGSLPARSRAAPRAARTGRAARRVHASRRAGVPVQARSGPRAGRRWGRFAELTPVPARCDPPGRALRAGSCPGRVLKSRPSFINLPPSRTDEGMDVSMRSIRFLALVLPLFALTAPAIGQLPLEARQNGKWTIAPMLKEVMPAVVNISVESTAIVRRNPLFDDPFFRRFFGVPDYPQQVPRQSVGSGVIVDADEGYVLTNHHVVQNANEIVVTLTDQRRFTA